MLMYQWRWNHFPFAFSKSHVSILAIRAVRSQSRIIRSKPDILQSTKNRKIVFMKTLVSGIRIICTAAILITGQALQASITVYNLACGSWVNPIGIDDPSPHLSWQLGDTSTTERSQSVTKV